MTSVSRWLRALGVFVLVVCSKAAWAQAPAPHAQQASEPEPWFPPVARCAPTCEAGFVCENGACISACNPPCGANERCNANAECELVEARPAEPPPPAAEVKPKPPEEKPNVRSTEWQTPPKKPTSLPYRHDGFFMRAAFGGAYSSASGSLGGRGFDLTGSGLTLQLAVGGTTPNGLVVGGLMHITGVTHPTYELEDGRKLSGGYAGQALIGPFVDYYIDPEAGFHLQLAAGLALASLTRDPGRPMPTEHATSQNALGAVVGTGYELFVGREFAMGLLGAFEFTAADLFGEETRRSGNIIMMAFGALLSVTHH